MSELRERVAYVFYIRTVIAHERDDQSIAIRKIYSETTRPSVSGNEKSGARESSSIMWDGVNDTF